MHPSLRIGLVFFLSYVAVAAGESVSPLATASTFVQGATRPGTLTPSKLAQDAIGAGAVYRRSSPDGFVSLFGGASIKPGSEAWQHAYDFGRLWGGQADQRIPLMTGGGPGAMQAANQGAREAGGVSLGFSTPFPREPKMNPFVTDGNVFHSLAQRESELVDRARGMVFVDGGVGTYWELLETITKIRTRQIAPVPVVLIGTERQWAPAIKLLEHMANVLHTSSPDILSMVKVVPDAKAAMETLRSGIGMPDSPTAPLPPAPRNYIPSPLQLAREARISQKLLKEAAPEGFVAVFGGSAPHPGDVSYRRAKEFGFKWTRATGGSIPIATGGGPGIMEAANAGAREAGGVSIGMIMAGLPGQPPNTQITHSYPFKAFAFRESELIDHATSAVFVRGGVGTAWEFFELLTKIQGGQIEPKPILLVGPDSEWRPLLDLLNEGIARGLVSPRLLSLIQRVETADKAVGILKHWKAPAGIAVAHGAEPACPAVSLLQ